MKCSLLTKYIRTFQSEEYDMKLHMLELNVKGFVKQIVEGSTVSLQQLVAVLKTNIKLGKSPESSNCLCSLRSPSLARRIEKTGR